MQDKPFWEETYKTDDSYAFAIEPNTAIKEFEYLYKKDWQILDVGCGEGKNPMYFAKNGYSSIDAFDKSTNAIEKVHRIQKKEELAFNAWVDDLRLFKFTKMYDLVTSFGTLFYVLKDEWKSFIDRAKCNTNQNGIHIIQVFTDKIPITPDLAQFAIGIANEGELFEVYKDWKVIDFKSYVFEDEHSGLPKHLHSANRIVAQKL